MRLWPLCAFVMALTTLFCSGEKARAPERELLIFAAMSLARPFWEIAARYEKDNPGIRVVASYAGSGTLAGQILQGAPADVFASASESDMNRVEEAGLIDDGARFNFASNELVLVAPADSKLDSFAALAEDSVRRIALGDPRSVPSGRYGMESLSFFGVKEACRKKLIYGAHVGQVCDYVVRREVDAGLVFYTDYVLRGNDMVLAAKAPASSHGRITYPIAVMEQGNNKKAAVGFIHLVLSRHGAAILRQHGFRAASREGR